jgi:hypothetical protein
MRSDRRDRNSEWREYVFAVSNQHVVIGQDDYLLSADGLRGAERLGGQKSGSFAVGMNASFFPAKNSNGFSEQTISGHVIAGRS